MELSGTSGPRPVRLPPALEPGDRVGVAALSGVVDPARLARGLGALRAMGYEPVEARNLRRRHGIFAGEDQERLDSFHELASDPTVRAILFARGGHGVLRILPGIDWRLLARHPRAYVGYSDLTPLLLGVVERLGHAAFHGPMVAGDLARGLRPPERESLRAALEGRLPLEYHLRGCRGSAEGRLLGGCLSMLEATLGTAWAPELAGSLLFLEDVDEPYYRLDRMLTHLRLSDNLAHLEGVVFGHLTGGRSRSRKRSHRGPSRARLRGRRAGGRLARGAERELVELLAGDFSLPFAWGLEAGHESLNLTLPLGLQARLRPTPGGGILTLGEGVSG